MSCAFGARMAMFDPVRDVMNSLNGGKSNSGTAFAAGLCTGALSNWAACPLFLAKTRIQAAAGVGVVDKSLIAELGSVQRIGGFTGHYAGGQALLMRGGCIAGGNMWGYDFGKRKLKAQGYREGPAMHCTCSVFSAITASVMAAPADLVLNRYHAALGSRAAYCRWASACSRVSTVCSRSSVASEPTSSRWRLLSLAPPLYEQFRRLAGLGYLKT